MNMIGISADCVCDLPGEYVARHGIGIIYFYITTSTGRFKDVHEITPENLLEYLEGKDHGALTEAPAVEEYCAFFEEGLKKYDEIIHICVSTEISRSYENATQAVVQLQEQGKRVHVIDSGHLSTGMGFVVIKAVELKEKGWQSEQMIQALESMRGQISTTFMTVNADYLYLNKRVSKLVRNLCRWFVLHPVLTMRDGRIALKKVEFGNYERAALRYIRGELRHNARIQKKRAFITHVGCSVKFIGNMKAEAKKYFPFEEVISTKASATISGNCGKGTFGILYVHEYGGEE